MIQKIRTDFLEIKPERLIFQQPEKAPETEADSSTGTQGSGRALEQAQETPKYQEEKAKLDARHETRRAEIIAQTEGTPAEDNEAAENLNKDLQTKSRSYFEQMDKGEKEDLDQLHQETLSNKVSYADLQGGWEWLGLKEEEQEKKYTKMAQMYLDKEETTSGQTVFKVKDRLNDSHKTMYGIGAGELLPPSVKAVEIEDTEGNKVQGTRKIVDGRVGYYDENGGYIPVFGGYKLRPLEFIDENSDDYKKQVEAEKQNYIETRESKNAYYEATSTMYEDDIEHRTSDPEEDPGRTNHPVSSLQSLESSTQESLTQANLEESEVAEALSAKEDFKKMKALIDVFGIRLSARSEMDGGSHLLKLGGKGSEKLGWNTDKDSEKKALFEKLSDKNYVKEQIAKWEKEKTEDKIDGITIVKDDTEENGYYFKNRRGQKTELEECVLEKVALSVSENETVTLIKAMQNGRDSKYKGYSFVGNYNFDIAHLDTLHKLTSENPEKLTKILEEAKKASDPIQPKKLLELASDQPITEGMSAEDAKALAARTPGMEYLVSGPSALQLDPLVRRARQRMAKGSAITEVTYNFDNYADLEDYPLRGGSNCCAAEVSTALGQGKLRQSVNENCVPDLIAGNLRRTGKEGIVIGFKNFKKGDVVVFAGDKSQRFTHVGIVRDRTTIDGEDYIIIQHDYANLQVDMVPVDGRSRGWQRHQRMMGSSSGRRELASKSPELASALEYRKDHTGTIRFRNNRYFQDASQGRGGNIAFAVRTETLT